MGSNTLVMLNDFINADSTYEKVVRIGKYWTSYLNHECIEQIRSFVEICRKAGVFDQEAFINEKDSCRVLTMFNKT